MQKVTLVLLLLLTTAIGVASYMWTGISPIKLYKKKENAIEYLFGRPLTQVDKERARRQAERMPWTIAYERAKRKVKQKYMSEGRKAKSVIDLDWEIKKEAQRILDAMDTKEKKRIVEGEYKRVLEEKKGGFFPLEMKPSNLVTYLKALAETVAIAIWGSIFAVAGAIPVSFFAAKNTLQIMVPGESLVHRSIRKIVQFGVRRVLDFCRGFNEFVMALVFVAIIGLGPFAGVLSLAVHTFGILGKVFSETVEAIEPGQVEAVTAGGASPLQIIAFAVMPQVMPHIVGYSLLRFESNVRSATILGFCGAGGIGFLIFDKLNGYLYREVATMMLLVIVSVTLIDYACGKLRSKFI